MKKAFLIFGLILGISEARFFMGISGGYLGTDTSYSTTEHEFGAKTKDIKHTSRGNGGIVGVMLGTEHFPHTDYVGWRWEIGGGYGHYFYKNLNNHSNDQGSIFYAHLVSDVLFNFYVNPEKLTFGIFIGAGIGWQKNAPRSPFELSFRTTDGVDSMSEAFNTISIPIRAGFSMLFNNHHRLEFYAQLPFAFQRSHKTEIIGNGNPIFMGDYMITTSTAQGLLSYKYVF